MSEAIKAGIQRRSPVSLSERFWQRVDISGGDDCCLLWLASTNKSGYGQIRREPVGNEVRGKTTTTHRVAWELTYGQIPIGMHVCHQCDNPLCVNPSHLWLGTHAQNLADMKTKGRSARGDRSGTARLNSKQVLAIRKILRADCCSRSEAASLVGVSSSSIDNIHNKSTWEHLDDGL